MIRINLLPFRAARKKENMRRQISIFFLFLFLVMVTFIYFNSYLNNRIGTLQSQVETVRVELKTYKKKAAEVDRIKKNLAVLEKKLSVIKNLEFSRQDPVTLMETLSEVLVPKRMWFEGVTNSGKSVTIKGVALDNKTVADFMTNLENSPVFSTVKLKTLKQITIQKTMKLKSFEITCAKSLKNIAKSEAKTR